MDKSRINEPNLPMPIHNSQSEGGRNKWAKIQTNQFRNRRCSYCQLMCSKSGCTACTLTSSRGTEANSARGGIGTNDCGRDCESKCGFDGADAPATPEHSWEPDRVDIESTAPNSFVFFFLLGAFETFAASRAAEEAGVSF